jgi:thimet oligopeptidase
MKKSRLLIAAVLFILAFAILLPAQTPAPSDAIHAWYGGTSPAELESWVNAHLQAEQQAIAQIGAVHGARTVENTLVPYDAAYNHLALAGQEAYLLSEVGSTAPLRDKAQAMVQKISSAATDFNLNQQVYQAVAAIGAAGLDPATHHYLDRSLLEYRLAGVDRDTATRQKIRQLQDRITTLQLTFQHNIDNDVRKIQATAAELDGLPADYVATHKPDAKGMITLTTDFPDSHPVMTYAKSADVRRRMYLASNNVAYPANEPVLRDLLTTREQLAQTLGYKTYADFATADQMIGSAANVQKLLDQVDQVTAEPAHREFALLHAFAEKQQPGVVISSSDASYWYELYSRATYHFDSQSVRPYFPYAEVQTGILTTAARLFHVSFKAAPHAEVWDPSVAAFDVVDRGKTVGRIYLDMHPRTGKYKWFANFPIVPGIGKSQLPEAALICNFPGGQPGDRGLMQYSDVVTFFHEFGHMMHYVLGSQGRWAGEGSFNVEGDFVEAPSQMLEEFFHDPVVLQSFARQYQTGEVLPASVIAQMIQADAFGRAGDWRGQVLYSTFALQLHDQDPAKIQFDTLYRQDAERFRPYQWVDGNHMYASFTHLAGYASNYYTYVLDKVIALDFFSQFNSRDLLDGPTAMRYRRTVLEPGATKPAADLVRDFLGRQENVDAMKAWMNQEFEPAATAAPVRQ